MLFYSPPPTFAPRYWEWGWARGVEVEIVKALHEDWVSG
jgi:hypothetical protein